MSAEEQTRLQIGHVLFIDVVGYSKLLVNQQSELLRELNEVVSSTHEFREAEAAGKLTRLPTGDGMALVFRTDPEAPAQCALEIARALKEHPRIALRMGIHSGPVNEVVDVNQRENIAGAGINMAQRVMDCGDAGHILVSKHVAEDLEQHDRWRPLLHDLGSCEVKHGARIDISNLYSSDIGNPQLPKKFQALKKHRSHLRWAEAAVALLVVVAIISAFIYVLRRSPTRSLADVVEKSIAVLPFANLSKDEENAFFADGVQDEILTNLSRIADLKVISRTSVMQYKSGVARNLRKIGEELGVAHVLEGSVQRANNRVRVNAQLVDARNDAHLWAETYDRDLADVFKIQTEIAKTIAEQLQARILPNEKDSIERQPTKDVVAWDLYVQATEVLANATNTNQLRENYPKAIALFERAVARDPSFVNAYCMLTQAHDRYYLIGGDHTATRLALAEQAVHSALRLQPDSPEAHLALADHLYTKLDYDGARGEIDIVRKKLPKSARALELSAYVDRRQGQWAESTRTFEQALELDPQNPVLLVQLAQSYRVLRQYSRQAAVLDRLLVLKPSDVDVRIDRAQVEFYWKADSRPLHAAIDAAIREDPSLQQSLAPIRIFLADAERDPAAGEQAAMDLGGSPTGPDAMRFPAAYFEGAFARLKGDSDRARNAFTRARDFQEKIVAAQPDYGPALCVLGVIDASLGRKEQALQEGRRAAELLPPSKDSINGPLIQHNLAIIYTWLGDKDAAIEQLQKSLQFPGRIAYGQLKLFPVWDPLRGDPRFEKIVNSLAPK